MKSETLQHHGIMGMKWGVRRYQNPDGSLTPAGKRRVDKLKKDYETITGRKLKDNRPKNWKDLAKAKPRSLNDHDLGRQINRLTNEKNALDLQRQINNETRSVGSKFVSNVNNGILKPAFINAGKNALTGFLEKKFKTALGMTKKDVDNVKKATKETAKTVDKEVTKPMVKEIRKQETKIADKSINDETIIKFRKDGQGYFDFNL